eukprot:Opistho-2@52696
MTAYRKPVPFALWTIRTCLVVVCISRLSECCRMQASSVARPFQKTVLAGSDAGTFDMFSEPLYKGVLKGNLASVLFDSFSADTSTFKVPQLRSDGTLLGSCADDFSLNMIQFAAPSGFPIPYRLSVSVWSPSNLTTAFRAFLVLQQLNTTTPNQRYFAVGCDSPDANYTVRYTNKAAVVNGSLGGLCVPTIADLTALLRGDTAPFRVRAAPVAMVPNRRYQLSVRLDRNEAVMALTFTDSGQTPGTVTRVASLSATLPISLDPMMPDAVPIYSWGVAGGLSKDGNITCLSDLVLTTLGPVDRYYDGEAAYAGFNSTYLENFESANSTAAVNGTANDPHDMQPGGALSDVWVPWAVGDVQFRKFNITSVPLPSVEGCSAVSRGPSTAKFQMGLPSEWRARALFAFGANGTASFGFLLRGYAATDRTSSMLTFYGCLKGSRQGFCRPAIVSSDSRYITRIGTERELSPDVWYRVEAMFTRVATPALSLTLSIVRMDGFDNYAASVWTHQVLLTEATDITLDRIGFVMGCSTAFCDGAEDVPPSVSSDLPSQFVDNIQLNTRVPASSFLSFCPASCVCTADRVLMSCISATGLSTLTIGRSSITSIHPDAFAAIASTLTSIFITDTALQHIPPEAFQNMTNVQYVDVSKNFLDNIDFVKVLPSLTELDASNNLITTIPDDLFRSASMLKRVDLGSNKLTRLPSGLFEGCFALSDLRVPYNRITSFQSSVFGRTRVQLYNLVLAGNKLGGNFDRSDPLAEDMPAYAFSNIVVLGTIDVSENSIERIRKVFWGANVERINCAANKISIIHERAFKDLKGILSQIILAGNVLTSLPSNIFVGQISLFFIDLSTNIIANLEPGTFDNLDKLKTIWLNGNALATVPNHIFGERPSRSEYARPNFDLVVRAENNPGSGGDRCSVDPQYTGCVYPLCQSCFCRPGLHGKDCSLSCAGNGSYPVAMENVQPTDRFGSGCRGNCSDCRFSSACDPVTGCICLLDFTGPLCDRPVRSLNIVLTAKDITATTVTLHWDGNSCSDCEYRLQRTRIETINLCQKPLSPTDDACYEPIETGEVFIRPFFEATTNRSDTDLYPSTEYRYRLQLRTRDDVFTAQEYTSLRTRPSSPPPDVRLIGVSQVSQSTLRVTWATVPDANGYVARYEVYRGLGGTYNGNVSLHLVASLGRDSRMFDDDGVDPGVRYHYVILATVDDSTERDRISLRRQLPAVASASAVTGVAQDVGLAGSGTGSGASASTGGGSSSLNVAVSVALPVATLLVCAVAMRWYYVRVRDSRRKIAHGEFLARLLESTDIAAIDIDRQAIALMEVLGSGEFGVVYRARVATMDGKIRICAVKTLKEGAAGDDRQAFMDEAKIMQGLSHPNVMNLVGVSVREEPLYLVLEYVAHDNLRRFCQMIPDSQRSLHVTISLLVQLSHHIASGMAYLHSAGIVHRDLAARNVMIGTNWGEYVAKVADFGLSRNVTGDYYRKTKKGGKIAVKWQAPESIKQRIYHEHSDVWSYGVTIWEAFSFGESPYAAVGNAEMASHLEAGHRLSNPASCPANMCVILERCW